MNFKDDFPMLNKGIIYFDNAATTFKPNSVIERIYSFYNNYSVNSNRSDYRLSYEVERLCDESRNKIKDFINANSGKEIIFTSGATEGLNLVIFGFFSNYLNKNDEVLLTKSEHASVVIPWMILSKKIGFKIKYIDLDDDYKLTIDNLNKYITKDTKVISIASTTNVIGDTRDIKKICEIANKNNILTLIDMAQSIGHMKTDVQDLNASFIAFSAHKMYGPFGIGVLYGKLELLDKLEPNKYGGGSNISFDKEIVLKQLPEKLESGTQNIPSIVAFKDAIEYIESIGLDVIRLKEEELREYAINKLKLNNNIIIYNENIKSNIITFNYKDIFAQDLAIYLSKNNIFIRAGDHCAKLLKDVLPQKNTCRISFSFYNTKDEIDKLCTLLDSNDILKESLF